MVIFKYSNSEYLLRDSRTNIEKWIKVKNGIIQKPLNYLNELTEFEHEEVMKRIINIESCSCNNGVIV